MAKPQTEQRNGPEVSTIGFTPLAVVPLYRQREIKRLDSIMPSFRAKPAERFLRSIKESCLEQTSFFGQTSVRKATTEFVVH
jgi:hypothetical protein